jgi:hypothetical protein
MIKYILTALILCLLVPCVFAQKPNAKNKNFKKIQRFYNNAQYAKTLEKLNKLESKEKDNVLLFHYRTRTFYHLLTTTEDSLRKDSFVQLMMSDYEKFLRLDKKKTNYNSDKKTYQEIKNYLIQTWSEPLFVNNIARVEKFSKFMLRIWKDTTATYDYSARISFSLLELSDGKRLITNFSPHERKRVIAQIMGEYEQLVKRDKKREYLETYKPVYEEIRKYIAKEGNEALIHADLKRAEYFSRYMAKIWHDTSQLFRILNEPLPILNYQTPATALNFASVDSFAKIGSSINILSTKQLATFLIKPYDEDVKKIRAIYMWIASNFQHENIAINTDVSAMNVLITKKTNAEGFANLFTELCKEAKIEAIRIQGISRANAKNKTQTYGHFWNAVKLYGNWYLIDATLASLTKEYDFFFFSNPEYLIFTHFPNDASWQLLKKIKLKEEFTTLPLKNAQDFKENIQAQQKQIEDFCKQKQERIELLRQELSHNK